jgi:hypothetical protein
MDSESNHIFFEKFYFRLVVSHPWRNCNIHRFNLSRKNYSWWILWFRWKCHTS